MTAADVALDERLLGAGLPGEIVITDVAAYATDWWPINTKRVQWGQELPRPAAVLAPRNPAELAAALRALADLGVAVVPRGLGSSVVGGAAATNGAVTVDTSRMTRLIDLDEVSLTVTVEAGMRGSDLEELLNARGLTCGHYPQSLALSTVGGWVATRASGTFSSKYGNIEELVLGVRWIDPAGVSRTITAQPRRSAGPDLRALLLGSEGMFGVVAEVTLKVFRLPAARLFEAFGFADVPTALAAVRELFQQDLAPAVVRLYDHSDHRRFALPDDVEAAAPVLFLGWDGHADVVAAMQRAGGEVLVAGGGRSLGAAPAQRWFDTRFDVSSLEAAIGRYDTFADTCEIAFPWSTAAAAYADVMAAFAEHGVRAHGHFSHVYHSGTSLYVVFVGGPATAEELERTYFAVWDEVMRRVLANGGTISHHHGVGRVRTPWIAAEYGDVLPVFEAIRGALDPDRRFNPELFAGTSTGRGGS